MELREEREALFGFTDGDQQAWTNAEGHKYDHAFLREINEARQDAEEVLAHETDPDASREVGAVSEQTIQTERSIDNDLLWSYNTPVTSSPGLTHLSDDGRSVNMVDVGPKKDTQRTAVAQTRVIFPPEVVAAFRSGADEKELVGPKGPIFATAKIAGIMAAK